MTIGELRTRVAELEAEVTEQRKLILSLSNRILAAHEVLARLSEKQPVKCWLINHHLNRKCEGV